MPSEFYWLLNIVSDADWELICRECYNRVLCWKKIFINHVEKVEMSDDTVGEFPGESVESVDTAEWQS